MTRDGLYALAIVAVLTLPVSAQRLSRSAIFELDPLVTESNGREVTSQLSNDDELTLESVSPVVIKTLPIAGTSNVDAGTKEIHVTFSKAMKGGTWSWATLSMKSFPRIDGDPKYLADKRTCVLPVRLEPGRTYAVWINTNKHQKFKDADGIPAVPYLLVFETAK